MATKQVERRQPPWWLPMAALFVESASLFLGPCFGAVTAAVGVYVSNQTHSAVTDTKLETIQGDVKQVREDIGRLTAQLAQKERDDGRTDQRLSTVETGVKEAKEKADQALARATNAQIDAKGRR